MKKLIALAAGAAVLALAAPAYAHVTVSGPGARQGGYATLTFKAPTESATASTTKLEIDFPTEAPIASVSVQPKAGWTWTEKTAKLATPLADGDGNQITEAVSSITWTATAGGIKPGEFDTFSVSAGPLPKVDSLAFAALQTYSDGTVVRWNQTAAPGSNAEPEHPKPTLTLTSASASASVDSATAASAKSSSSDTTSRTLSIVALALAAVAISLTVVSRAKREQPK